MIPLHCARKLVTALLVPVFVLLLCGCETVQFYRQAVWGQWQLLAARQPTMEMLDDAETAPWLAERLRLSRDVLNFAAHDLGLDAQGRYSSYVHLKRDYVMWNVFAVAPYTLDDDQWCYPMIGCMPYRGYFDERRARQTAHKYASRGMETYVVGVPAYSTLGWFDDPLLSTFLSWPETDLVNLLIHELAHGRVWINGDATFNESFAEFVGNRGAQAWFERRDEVGKWRDWLEERAEWKRFRSFVLQVKQHLHGVYRGPQAQRKIRKTLTLQAAQACYERFRGELGNGRYDKLMTENFNNAFLLSVGTYADWLPAFENLFHQANGDWAAFFDAVQDLASESRIRRETSLDRLTQQQIAQHADHTHTDEINCEPFPGHSAYGKAPG